MKVLLFANTDWYLFNFRRSLAVALRDAGYEVVLLSPPGEYGPRLQEMGFRWISAPLDRRSLNPARELAFVLWLRRLIVAEKVDLVHGFTIKCAVYGSIAGRLAGVGGRVNAVAGMGYVFTSDAPKARALRPFVRLLMRYSFNGRNARLILQNPDDVALFERARIVDRQNIRLIPGSGVDCQRFLPLSTSDDFSSAGVQDLFRVVLPARLLWDKGVAEYIEAARRLLAQGRNIEFLLAGSPDPGNPAAVPEEQVRAWVAEGTVKWLGHVSDMPGLFRGVDLVVLPSYREGLPKGLIEAAACELPLITTDVPGCREVVSNEVDGLLVPARDSGALGDAIVRMHEHPEMRLRLARAARAKALDQFDEAGIIRRTIEVYRELMPAASR